MPASPSITSADARPSLSSRTAAAASGKLGLPSHEVLRRGHAECLRHAESFRHAGARVQPTAGRETQLVIVTGGGDLAADRRSSPGRVLALARPPRAIRSRREGSRRWRPSRDARATSPSEQQCSPHPVGEATSRSVRRRADRLAGRRPTARGPSVRAAGSPADVVQLDARDRGLVHAHLGHPGPSADEQLRFQLARGCRSRSQTRGGRGAQLTPCVGTRDGRRVGRTATGGKEWNRFEASPASRSPRTTAATTRLGPSSTRWSTNGPR